MCPASMGRVAAAEGRRLSARYFFLNAVNYDRLTGIDMTFFLKSYDDYAGIKRKYDCSIQASAFPGHSTFSGFPTPGKSHALYLR